MVSERASRGVPAIVLRAIRDAEEQRRRLRSAMDPLSPMPTDRPSVDGDRYEIEPYVWTDPSLIPPRQWLYGRSLIRKFVTVTVAPGGVGKSSLTIVEALALVTGRPLLGKNVERPLTVWMWNLEDPLEELTRRIQAACEHYDVSAEDIGNRLYVSSGRDQALCIASSTKNRTVFHRPVIDRLQRTLLDRRVDVLFIDPFVSSHGVAENDNGGMDAVAKEWGRIADATNSAVHLVHHTRKLGSDAEVTAESSRGGKSLTDAARDVRVVNRMSPEDGERYGVNHRSFFRMMSDKPNMAPPSDLSDWHEIKNILLPNGDHVGVVTSWSPPDAFDGVSSSDLLRVQQKIHAGDWREDIRSPSWAGNAVAEVLGLDVEAVATRHKIKTLLKTWIMNGALRVDVVADDKRRERRVVRVGSWSE